MGSLSSVAPLQAPASNCHVARLTGGEAGWRLLFHAPLWRRLAPHLVAALGCAAALVWAEEDLRTYLVEVDWSFALWLALPLVMLAISWPQAIADHLRAPAVRRGRVESLDPVGESWPRWIRVDGKTFRVPPHVHRALAPGGEVIVEHTQAGLIVTIAGRDRAE